MERRTVCLYRPIVGAAPGEMTEWSKVHDWKSCVPARVPRVRIPLSPLRLRLRSDLRRETGVRRRILNWGTEGLAPLGTTEAGDQSTSTTSTTPGQRQWPGCQAPRGP